MTLNNLISTLNAVAVNVCQADREVSCGYAGDFLSFVMGRAPENCAWFTVMTNVNICAVAALADISVIVVCEDCRVDEDTIKAAQTQNINIITTKLDVFGAIKAFLELDAGLGVK